MDIEYACMTWNWDIGEDKIKATAIIQGNITTSSARIETDSLTVHAI